jgi:hypothetical protein
MNSYSAFQGTTGGGSGTPAPGTCQADVKGFIQPIITAAIQRGMRDIYPLFDNNNNTATTSQAITALQNYKKTIDKDLATLNNPKKWPSSCATNSEFKNEMKIFSAAYNLTLPIYNSVMKNANKYKCTTVKEYNTLLQNNTTQDIIDYKAQIDKWRADALPLYKSWELMMSKYNLTMN